jgi:hypothetical protein
MEYKSKTKNCQNCKKDFMIESEDFNFYEKIKVPAPTWCPRCRMIRRISFINIWSVYFRNCDKCGVKTLTMHHPKSKLEVYCDPCWWSDDWDGTEYGIEYDSSKTFFEQWLELRNKTPHFSKDAAYTSLKNCEYTNGIGFSKNCYMVFWADHCDNVFYSSFLNKVKDSLDILRVYNSELIYESVGIGTCSRVYFSRECDNCVDVWFSRNCYGCTNCFGCVNLRSKNYMIFNKEYSREEYFKKLKEFKINTRSGLLEAYKEAEDFWLTLPYREYTGNSLNLNVSGDYIYESKNAKNCYMCSGAEDCKYTQFISVLKATNCMDYSGWGNGASLIYESGSVGEGIENLKFCFGMFNNGIDSEYCDWCVGSNNNFGCSNLKRKKYCILNKQYSKERYLELKEKIIEDINKNPYKDNKGRIYKYGEFFPPEFSPFPYQDSNANKFIPKNKEEILSEGYVWKDKEENFYKKTIDIKDIPEKIIDTNDDILKEIIECNFCKKGFRITKGELLLYRKFDIPILGICFNCREERRFDFINMPNSYESNCDKCDKKIITMHDPKKRRIIYCEDCYKKEVY